jgi:hypothetical protein
VVKEETTPKTGSLDELLGEERGEQWLLLGPPPTRPPL